MRCTCDGFDPVTLTFAEPCPPCRARKPYHVVADWMVGGERVDLDLVVVARDADEAVRVAKSAAADRGAHPDLVGTSVQRVAS